MHLKIESGAISLGILSGNNPVNGQIAEGVSRQAYRLRSDGSWIMRDSERLLLVPIELCATCFATTSSRVAIGCKSEDVLLFDFDIST